MSVSPTDKSRSEGGLASSFEGVELEGSFQVSFEFLGPGPADVVDGWFGGELGPTLTSKLNASSSRSSDRGVNVNIRRGTQGITANPVLTDPKRPSIRVEANQEL